MKMINTAPQNIQTAINISANQVGGIYHLILSKKKCKTRLKTSTQPKYKAIYGVKRINSSDRIKGSSNTAKIHFIFWANQVGSIQRGSKDAHDYLKGDEDER